MFIDKTTDDEFFAALQGGMKKAHSFDEELHEDQLKDALRCLATAAYSLNNAGLQKEAKMCATLQHVCEDPVTKNLTSAKMLKHLKDIGWVFPKPKDSDNEVDLEVVSVVD